jgi:hypothetical protein
MKVLNIRKKDLKEAITFYVDQRRALNLNDYNATDWAALSAVTAHLDGLLNTAKRLGWHDLETYALANL